MKLTYRTLPYDDDEELQGADIEFTESGGNTGGEIRNKTQWDDDCAWSEWYSAEDPVKGFKLITIWEEKTVESSLEMAELENASLHEAEKWFIFPEISPYLDGSKRNMVGFASQLRLLVSASVIALEAQFMEDFVSVENSGSDNLKSSAVIPPPTVLDRVLKELFHEGVKSITTESEHKSSRTIKGAPLESLFAQFCLHSLWFGDCNIRAIAVLWIEFVREVRWCWEESQPLPRMPACGVIDLSTCLINQKLHMLAICIEKKRQQDHKYEDGFKKNDNDPPHVGEHDLAWGNSSHLPGVTEGFVEEHDSPSTSAGLHGSGTTTSGYDSMSEDNVKFSGSKPSDHVRRGSAGVVGSMMLLKSQRYMHAPFTQDAPIMTEDMHEERLHAVEALGDSFSFSAQLERDILLSDMSAFKAANPDAVFEDFIRWHSPKDWENDTGEEGGASEIAIGDIKSKWPPRGRLSERMSECGNSWRKIWNDAPALPVSEQKPLLDPNREGEKALHYLETLRPHLLLEQMVCTAFRAAADTLNHTTFGGLKQMTTKIGQLYLTMASVLKPLQANQLSRDSEISEDLERLCVVFENVEKLLMLAASLHRKFLRAPRLSESIFNDFYNYYIPNWGKGSVGDDGHKEFDKRQEVWEYERDVVTSMFAQPSANQSWRRISMGNLLNGHEPIVREIVFSMRDTMNSSYYAANNPWGRQQEIETYRMYICGTSNDLRVALSVASCD